MSAAVLQGRNASAMLARDTDARFCWRMKRSLRGRPDLLELLREES